MVKADELSGDTKGMPRDGVTKKTPLLIMISQSSNKTCHTGHRADKKGLQLSVRNQADIEKFPTGSNSPESNVLRNIPEQPNAQRGLLNTNIKNLPKGIRQQWSRKEYKEVMEAYYYSMLDPWETAPTKASYNIWRLKNPTERSYLNANKLATVRRDIEGNQRLTEHELKEIEVKVWENLRIHETGEQKPNPENEELSHEGMNEDLNSNITDEVVIEDERQHIKKVGTNK